MAWVLMPRSISATVVAVTPWSAKGGWQPPSLRRLSCVLELDVGALFCPQQFHSRKGTVATVGSQHCSFYFKNRLSYGVAITLLIMIPFASATAGLAQYLVSGLAPLIAVAIVYAVRVRDHRSLGLRGITKRMERVSAVTQNYFTADELEIFQA